MTSGFDEAINAMMADLHKQQEDMVRLQDRMGEVTGTATSPRNQVEATVDSQGGLTELRFHGNAFRKMAAEELANLIVETVREAQQVARRTLWEQVGDFGPPGADLAAFAEGNLDWTRAFAETLTLPQPLLDLLGTPPASDLFGHAAGDEPPANTTNPTRHTGTED